MANGIQALQFPQIPEAGFFNSSPMTMFQAPTKTPQQQSAINTLLSMGLQGLANPQKGYEPFAASARQNFSENTLPSIFERFSSLGKGAQSSGAFQGMLARGGADLESQLAQGGSQYGQQQQQLFQNLLGMGLQPSFENILKPREASGFETALPKILEIIGKALAAASFA